MPASNAPEESDSRTSSVGRKRGSAQISQNPSTASSSTGESSGASSRASRRSRKKAKKDIDEIDDAGNFDKKQRIELDTTKEQENAAPRIESSAAGTMSWNKGVQPTLRTSFGGKAAKTLKGSSKLNTVGGVSALHTEGKNTSGEDMDAVPTSSEQPETTKPPKKTRTMKQNETKMARLQATTEETPLPKPTQKLNVGGDDGEVWIKYSLEHNPLPHAAKQSKIKHWIRREVQNRFVPHLLAYNVDVLEKLDEDKVIEVLRAFIDHQPAYDDFAKSEGHKIIEDKSFKGYCRNQLKAALNQRKEDRKQHKGNPVEMENSFGKLVSSADISNAASDFDEDEFEEDDEGEDMDISIVESNESGEIEDDATNASELLQMKQSLSEDKASATGKRSRADSEESNSPHPVDAAIESRLSGGSRPDEEAEPLVPAAPPPKNKSIPPVAGLPQQPLLVLAEVQKYYPGLACNETYCLTCNSSGHAAAFCPKLTCETCGLRGEHFTYACPQNIICSKCRAKGHRVQECKEKLARSVADGVVCEICRSTKHIGDNCHLLWRSYNPDKMDLKKVAHMLIDCYSCGALNHSGTECGLRGTRMPYAGQTWTAENRARYLEGKNSGAKNFEPRTMTGMTIRGMARNDPVNISDDEDASFIRPKLAPPPQKQHLKFSDRVSMPNAPPPPRNNNLPMYAQQPPPPPPQSQNWGAVQGNGAYRETFSRGGGMDYADDFRANDDFHSFSGRDHDELYRSSGRGGEPFKASGSGGGNGRNGGGGGGNVRDPFPARQQPRNAGPSPSRGGRPPANSGRGGGGGRGRGGSSGGGGRGGRGGASGGRGGRGGRR